MEPLPLAVHADLTALDPPGRNDAAHVDASDGELVLQAREGNRDAFALLLERHRRLVLGLCLRILGNLPDAQDAAQETFLRLFRSLNRLDTTRPCRPWLCRVAINVCRDLHGRRPTLVVDLEDATDRAETGRTPHEAMLLTQKRELLSRALMELPFRERAAVVLRDVEGLETEEVAEILGSSVGTIRTQACRGRQKLTALVGRLIGRQT